MVYYNQAVKKKHLIAGGTQGEAGWKRGAGKA